VTGVFNREKAVRATKRGYSVGNRKEIKMERKCCVLQRIVKNSATPMTIVFQFYFNSLGMIYTWCADKSLARHTFRCILFDGENISFDASLVLYIYIHIHVYVYIYTYVYIYITNIPPIIITNRLYETQKLL
jgi:hypothetical protein